MKINTPELTPNTRVVFKYESKDGYEIYQSRIEDVTSEFVIFAMPMRGGEIVPLQVGRKLEINFTKDDGLYVFRSLIVKRERDPIPLLYVTRPRQVKRQQRRQFVRVETFIPLSFRRLTVDETKEVYEKCRAEFNLKDISETLSSYVDDEIEEVVPPNHQGIVHNISGGGLLFVCEQKVSGHELLLLNFSLETDGEAAEIYARVIRSYEFHKEDTSYPFSLGVEYLIIDQEWRHKIIQYTFNRQIELKKKGIS